MFGQVEHHTIETQVPVGTQHAFAFVVKHVDPLLVIDCQTNRRAARRCQICQFQSRTVGMHPDKLTRLTTLCRTVINDEHDAILEPEQVPRARARLVLANGHLVQERAIVAEQLQATAQ